MNHLLFVALGGGAGAAMRHLVGLWTLRLLGAGFPYGTLMVNVVGSFLMGVLVEMLALKFNGPAGLRLFLATGFLGGFTTFSSFSLDVAVMAERGDVALAALYVAVSTAGGFAGIFLGLYIARNIFA